SDTIFEGFSGRMSTLGVIHRSFTQHEDTERGRRTSSVLIVSPGGLEHGGEIGRQRGYFRQALVTTSTDLANGVVDSRGPWFIGASPLSSFGAVTYLGYAVLTLLLARCSLRPPLLHVNITGRGSTIRKVLLLTVARVLGLRYILHVHDCDYADYYKGRRP